MRVIESRPHAPPGCPILRWVNVKWFRCLPHYRRCARRWPLWALPRAVPERPLVAIPIVAIPIVDGWPAICYALPGGKKFLARYLLKTVLTALPTLLGVATVVFLLIHLTPGDPVMAILGPYATAESVEELRNNLGLDRPLIVQYGKFMGGLLRGDLGRSLVTEQPVLIETLRLFPYTAQLALAGVFMSIVLGIPVGVISAVRRNSALDYIARSLSILGISVPVFFLAIILLLVFGFHLGWLPITGAGDASQWSSLLRHLVLPAATVGISMAVLIMRLTRSCMLEVLSQDYIRTARAKGLSEKAVILIHALRNALLPIVTVVGLSMGNLLGGAILVETVFARQGVGKLLLDAIIARDYPQVQGTVLLIGSAIILVNMLVDIAYRFLDPRIKL
jgi:peptide/nickel transport system permease protein